MARESIPLSSKVEIVSRSERRTRSIISMAVQGDSSTNSGEDISPLAKRIFYGAFGLTQVCGVAFLCLLIDQKVGSLKTSPKYFWHPLLASLGLIILQSESLLIYRILRNVRKPVTKVAHAALHFTAFASVFTAITIMFVSNNDFGIPASFHGKMGLLTTTLFLIQYVVAFLAFLAPGFAGHIRAKLMPIHVFGGMFIFLLSCYTANLKLLDGWAPNLPANAVLILYALLVSVCVCFASFRRRPIPRDNTPLCIN